METCSYCNRVCADASEYLDHHASILQLLDSSEQCSMCRFLLRLYDGTDTILQAKERAQNGRYTKLKIITVARKDQKALAANVALKHMEITTNDRVWTSRTFAITTEIGKYSTYLVSSPENNLRQSHSPPEPSGAGRGQSTSTAESL